MINLIKQLLGALSPVHIWWVTATQGLPVGTDQAGNRYFRGKKLRPGYKYERRWVLYNGVPEASKVPPEWHGWLHHQTDVVPSAEGESYRQPWQKPHKPNRTGTDQAYRPAGHILKGGKRPHATGDYEAWTPSE